MTRPDRSSMAGGCWTSRRRSGSMVGQRQRYAVGPPKPILGRVSPAPGSPIQIHDVVLLRHPPGRAIGAAIHGEPAVACLIRDVASAVAAYPLDRQPLQRRPAVGSVPLLA